MPARHYACNLVEYGLFQSHAFVEVNSRVLEVPLWVFAEWKGGFGQLVDRFGLGSSTERPTEREAFNNIHEQAYQLHLYYTKGYDKSLSRLHLDCIRIERRQMIEAEARCLLGKEKYQWIALKLNKLHGMDYSWQQARALLEEATEAAQTAMERQRQKDGVRLLQRLQEEVEEVVPLAS